MEAEISLVYASSRIAKGVVNALTPDNKMPRGGIRVTTRLHRRTLKVLVENCVRIETMQATVQDIFRCLRAAESCLSMVALQEKA